MKIALIGATGNAGGCLLEEALARGHQVTAIARSASSLEAREGLEARDIDVTDSAVLAGALAGHDAVISSVRFLQASFPILNAGIASSGVKRWLVVGGAGGLLTADGKRLLDSPNFPEAAKAEANAGLTFLENLRQSQDLDWTFISPSALFVRGEKTGSYRKGYDQLLVDSEGKSHISMEDYAVALLDELQAHEHSQRRITVGK